MVIGQITVSHLIFTAADFILGNRNTAVIRTDHQRHQLIIGQPLCPFIAVRQHFPLVAVCFTPLIQRILFARLKPGAVNITVVTVWRRFIRLRHAGDHLLIQRLAQRRCGLQFLLCIAVFIRQILNHLRITAGIIPQPVIVIRPGFTMCSELYRAFRGLRDSHSGS